jgi:hypothetical protein
MRHSGVAVTGGVTHLAWVAIGVVVGLGVRSSDQGCSQRHGRATPKRSGSSLLATAIRSPADETIEDVTWLADTAQLGLVVLAKDARIRRRPAALPFWRWADRLPPFRSCRSRPMASVQ